MRSIHFPTPAPGRGRGHAQPLSPSVAPASPLTISAAAQVVGAGAGRAARSSKVFKQQSLPCHPIPHPARTVSMTGVERQQPTIVCIISLNPGQRHCSYLRHNPRSANYGDDDDGGAAFKGTQTTGGCPRRARARAHESGRERPREGYGPASTETATGPRKKRRK